MQGGSTAAAEADEMDGGTALLPTPGPQQETSRDPIRDNPHCLTDAPALQTIETPPQQLNLGQNTYLLHF